jgi:hypothetical protein
MTPLSLSRWPICLSLVLLAGTANAADAPPKEVRLFPQVGQPHSIVFACDASGSMVPKLASLKAELRLAVDALRPDQSFDVVFFQDGKAPAFGQSGPVPATPANKQRLAAFLDDVTATSTSDPLAGLAIAFRRRVEQIYLLTDGDFPDNDAVLKKVRSLNRTLEGTKPARIDTVAFVNNKDTDTYFLKTLEVIAKENHGTFRLVREDDLSAPPAIAPATRPDAPPAARQDPPQNSEAHAKQVVYLCNASASVKAKFTSIKKELGGAIDGLKPDQQFDVVIWQDGLAIAFQRDAPAPATDENKKRCAAFLDRAIARGNKNAIPAIVLAFKLKPDLIYLLTDSDFPDNDAVLKKVRELNKPGADGKTPTKVNTIAFVNEKDADTKFLKLLETIAEESGGHFSRVAENELK